MTLTGLFTRNRRATEDLLSQLSESRQTNAALELKLKLLHDEYSKLKDSYSKQQKGIQLLLQFVKGAHRLDQPFVPGEIRTILQESMNRK